ncbi:enoyl-CoA hydratase/isomerase family protein [Chloroflexi bacterium TSY]|nr:enoyl-CoA hydratase/isomerase family protein [Chloroflexi bacterium TSY]
MNLDNLTNESSPGSSVALPMLYLDDHILCVAISTAQSSKFDVELIQQLATTVQTIRVDESIRAIILVGGPKYFSAGGSSTALVEANQHNNILFRAIEIPRLLLKIPVPTIAAMAGHAIGGGFMMGIWCDIPVLAEESRYGMNAVTLGVPPIMGATEILPDVIGTSLTQRMLYTGRLVKGRTFKTNESGLAGTVLPKADVWPHALSLAQEIAETPRDVLVLAKRQLIMRRHAMLTRVADAEMAMLQLLFSQRETRERIAERYPVPLNT